MTILKINLIQGTATSASEPLGAGPAAVAASLDLSQLSQPELVDSSLKIRCAIEVLLALGIYSQWLEVAAADWTGGQPDPAPLSWSGTAERARFSIESSNLVHLGGSLSVVASPGLPPPNV